MKFNTWGIDVMPVSAELLLQITEAVKNRPVVIPEEVRLATKPMAVTINREGAAYANPRVTEDVDKKIGRNAPVEYVKFVPVEEAGVVLMRRSRLGEDGAIPFLRSRSGRTGRFEMGAALAGFHLNFGSNRTMRCSYDSVEVEVQGEGGSTAKESIGVIQVKNPRRKRGTRRRQATTAPASQAGQ